MHRIIHFFLQNKLAALLLALLFIGWGLAVAPFNWAPSWLPSDTVPVDAIPNLGDNQQIVYTPWEGRSPEDIEDQITYPLTAQLLGLPGVKSVRSNSMTGFSAIYVIFDEDIDFYWSRSRILEKLNALPNNVLPSNVKPSMGPDATGLGQIFWYTLEGQNSDGETIGGWDLQELRSIQDFYVGYALSAVEGVAEVAPAGGFVKEYQIDVNPTALQQFGISLDAVYKAVKNSNSEIGARTIELNNAEYIVRALGYVKSVSDLEDAVVKTSGNTSIRIRDIAFVTEGPAPRRGVLDKNGKETVGAVVVSRFGENPLAVIDNVKKKIEEITPGLPSKTLPDGSISKVTIVPFYDRTGLIYETIGTLEDAISLQILITIIVVLVMVLNLRASFLISIMLPVAVLMSFIAMKYFGVDANIVSLSGIAIAIGTVVDVGIIMSENILQKMQEAKDTTPLFETIKEAAIEVSSAIVTAVATTVVSFLPVFAMVAEEGKLFKPLAYTKTFVLLASVFLVLVMLPPLAHAIFSIKIPGKILRATANFILVFAGLMVSIFVSVWLGLALLLIGGTNVLMVLAPQFGNKIPKNRNNAIVVLVVAWLLTMNWMPLGVSSGFIANLGWVALVIGLVLWGFSVLIKHYEKLLYLSLNNKKIFLAIPFSFVFLGLNVWLGFSTVFSFLNTGFSSVNINLSETSAWKKAEAIFPGLGREFMPPLDEGSFLLMPVSLPHVGVSEAADYLQQMDAAVAQIPEVDWIVGKLGRAETALDPAPVSMFENVIVYKPEFKADRNGRRLRFKTDAAGEFIRDDSGSLIADSKGNFFRQWRNHIHSPDDIWNEVIKAISIPGLTTPPKLQPIETRLMMLQTGMRAAMGIKVKGPDLETIEEVGMKLEEILKEVPGVNAPSVFAERIIGKPYLEIEPDREQLGRYGLSVAELHNFISIAVGGEIISYSVEGRERYPIRVRYPRELRDNPEAIESILIPVSKNVHIPLGQLATISFRAGAQSIRSEDTFLTSYVTFGKVPEVAEVDVVEAAKEHIRMKMDSGGFALPVGVSLEFAGNFENQVRAINRLKIIIPIVLVVIFMILYFQFRSTAVASMIFTGIFVAWSGGFLLLWLYSMPGFLDVNLFGIHLREVLQIQPVNMSIAVWVGFIALFGIAVDDGVVMATYQQQTFSRIKPKSVNEVRAAVLSAGLRRVRPCLMTSATTILALLPIITSTGKGSDIMIPMAIPALGGMSLQLITLFVVPVLYSAMEEWKINKTLNRKEEN